MFRIIALLLFTGLFSLTAQAVSIDPDNCGTTLVCYETSSNSNLGTSAAIEAAFGLSFDPDLSLYYKNNQDGSTGGGTFLTSYSTTYLNTPSDPAEANIAYVSGASITCPECYLLVKDGSSSPAQYLINLGSWNGLETLALTGFWDAAGPSGSGAISNVAIWGRISPVPVPAAVWLFGTALLGFIGMSRRTKV